MIQLVIASEVVEALGAWRLRLANWTDGPGDWVKCDACRDSPLVAELEFLAGAPHRLVHEFLRDIRELAAVATRAIEADCSGLNQHPGQATVASCAHEAEACDLVKGDLRDFDLAIRDEVDRRVSTHHRSHLEAGENYVIRMLERWLSHARSWVPTEAGVMPHLCATCSSHPRRGEQVVIRLPHDLRHDLLALLDELVDDFEADNEATCPHCKTGVSLTTSAHCRHRRAGASLVHEVWLRAQLAFQVLLNEVIDPRRRDWMANYAPSGVNFNVIEVELASNQPAFDGRLWAALTSLTAEPPQQVDDGCLTESTCFGSPYAQAACPTMHWPHWLIHGVVETVAELRATIFLERRDAVERGDRDSVTMVDFDSWIFERLRHMDSFENSAALAVERRFGTDTRRRMGLRLSE